MATTKFSTDAGFEFVPENTVLLILTPTELQTLQTYFAQQGEDAVLRFQERVSGFLIDLKSIVDRIAFQEFQRRFHGLNPLAQQHLTDFINDPLNQQV